MSLVVTYSPECDVAILRIPYKTAERVCMAVVAFASDGSGQIEYDPDDPSFVCIRAKGGLALAEVDEHANRINVARILSSTPPPRRPRFLDEPAFAPPADRE
jgi:hypothetical protein